MFPFSKVIGVCWAVFWLYWFISAFGSKKNIGSNIKHFVGLRLGIIVLVVILLRLFNRQTLENPLATKNELVLTIGFMVFLVGLIIAIWARLYLGRNWGMPMTQKQTPELVTTGPYNYIRHPIYSGILLAGVGSALATGIYWLLITAAVGIYFIYSAVIEERLMMQQFPKIYPTYKHKTKMLIPFIL